MYESKEILIPTIFDKTNFISDYFIAVNDTKLEKIIRFAIQFFYEWVYYNQDKNRIELV